MAWVVSPFLILFILLVSTTSLNHISILGIKPDLFLLFIVILSLYSSLVSACLIGFTTGLVKDAFTEGPLGLSAIIFLSLCFIVGVLREKIFLEHIVTQAMVTFVSSITYNGIHATVVALSKETVTRAPFLVVETFAVALYTSMLAFAVILILKLVPFTKGYFIARKPTI